MHLLSDSFQLIQLTLSNFMGNYSNNNYIIIDCVRSIITTFNMYQLFVLNKWFMPGSVP